MKKKVMYSSLLVILLLAVGVNAVWLTSISDDATITINSDDPNEGNSITMVDPISDVLIDSTTSQQVISEPFSFDNTGVETSMYMDFLITKLDVDDNCFDYENDVTIELIAPAWVGSFVSGDSVTVRPGFNNWEAIITAEELSCPQVIEVFVELYD